MWIEKRYFATEKRSDMTRYSKFVLIESRKCSSSPKRLLCVFIALLSVSCTEDPTTAAVGVACLPYDEYDPTFSGFAAFETSIETAHVDCAAESVCLIHRFQGRVSCPYGQDRSDLQSSIENSRRCFLPSGSSDLVSVAVEPQLVSSRARESAYCSALCADSKGNRKDNRRYHDCPPGFHCENLDGTVLAPENLSGSYCVRDGTKTVNELQSETSQRDASGSSGNCGEPQPLF